MARVALQGAVSNHPFQITVNSFPVWPHVARYCDTIAAIPHIARYFLREVSVPPKWCDTLPWYLILHRHICAIPHFATYRAIPHENKHEIILRYYRYKYRARYEKYRCWASKLAGETCAANRLATTLFLLFWGFLLVQVKVIYR